MKNNHFQFKEFIVQQQHCAMKVCTDACLFGAWIADWYHRLNLPVHNVLDIGTGTGLLSLMMAQKTNVLIDAMETDTAACRQAVENVKTSAWKNRINVIQNDVRTYRFSRKYDLIISNPPFYENDLPTQLHEENIARHSEELTLSQLLEVVTENLLPTGYFAVLLPYHRTSYFQTRAAASNLHLHAIMLVKHSSRHPYFRSMLLYGRFPKPETVREEITIKVNNEYTKEFTRLLQDYYLYL